MKIYDSLFELKGNLCSNIFHDTSISEYWYESFLNIYE